MARRGGLGKKSGRLAVAQASAQVKEWEKEQSRDCHYQDGSAATAQWVGGHSRALLVPHPNECACAHPLTCAYVMLTEAHGPYLPSWSAELPLWMEKTGKQRLLWKRSSGISELSRAGDWACPRGSVAWPLTAHVPHQGAMLWDPTPAATGQSSYSPASCTKQN